MTRSEKLRAQAQRLILLAGAAENEPEKQELLATAELFTRAAAHYDRLKAIGLPVDKDLASSTPADGEPLPHHRIFSSPKGLQGH
jgi:hypothetical protein